ncbi:ABC transporter permease [Saccharopolyspora phatthalungensis]|uniref:Putative spermidine/putrescine transport system permease protein n=1 Tax=Saccharopolyspora phatthalungensis TaxID=664693 RepID=A0A840QDU3_9PSEU|nr:ABC transporter permease [Saccharopolyspora phatthalungensis]MBB5158954.1 putative spermidine/putrescine transport system permease protein [Saccharopolyspora phatthalungensis]
MTAVRRRLGLLLVAPGTAYLVLAFCSVVLLLVTYSVRTEQTSTLFAAFDLGTWRGALADGYLWSTVGTTLRLGLLVTLICVLIAYPLAWCIRTLRRNWQIAVMLFVIFSPILVSVVVRSYGWAMLLRTGGPLGGVFDDWLYHEPGVVLALVHVELPFAFFPILAAVRAVPAELGEAAADLGAEAARRFWRVQCPLTMPGLLSGAQLTFTLTISAFATPALLGGGRVTVLAQSIYQDIQQLQWPRAAVQAVVLLVLTLIVLAAFTLAGRLIPGSRRPS